MRRRTTTKQLLEAITNNLLQITKAETHYKSSDKIDVLTEDSFKESLEFLAETIFADMVDWHFQENVNADKEYILDSGRMNPYSDNVVTVYLRVCDGENVEDVERILKIEEE
ncbi:hypothetical protein E5329_16980 [Petralouisia muris]|uniref:Uncharacterized protein n=1 Tax=Petralouisia muris TaxID=3032872 RepID=A0AC61RT84_9FIRM|nr:hypothetical protein [Petralouisia muris]TGY94989.1 hypothetical protein E5329_16980 [Petralouisia muris]